MKPAKRKLILKLNRIFSLGYIPSREKQSYSFVVKPNTKVSSLINCFAHSCFNLTNKQIEKYNITKEEAKYFWELPLTYENIDEDLSRIIKFVNSTGLDMKLCSETTIMKSNQWKVAFYFEEDFEDYHFMLQEKNGLWSSKLGSSTNIKLFDDAPEKFNKNYKLHSFYSITNNIMRERG